MKPIVCGEWWVVAAARGALITSGVGLVATLATNFAAGAVGSALEQKIGRETVNFRESVTSGLTNAVSGAIYGNNPLVSAKDAFVRGAKSGAATAGINNLSNAWNNRNSGLEDSGGISGITTGGLGTSPYGVSRDPRAGCGAQNPFVGNLGYLSAHGYQYKDSGTKQTKKGGFSLIDFAKDVAIGTVLGGLGSLAFYKATKPVDTLKNSTRNASTAEARGNKGGSEIGSTVTKKPIIMGENMKRVTQYAEEVDGHAYKPWKNDPFDFGLGMKRNKRWINDMMKEGREIIDIGPDFSRRSLGRKPSPFYNMERS